VVLGAALAAGSPAAARPLGAADVERIIGQAVAEARAVGLEVNVAVVDHEGNALGTLRMPGAREFTVLRGGGPPECQPPLPPAGCGVEGLRIPPCGDPPLGPCAEGPPPNGGMLAALSKAGTAAFFSTGGNAFTTRTAGFIVQQHFPPLVRGTPGGPLFGVQFSQLPCGDVLPPLGVPLPLGLAADPGGVPLYRGGRAVGGVGVEGDGRYTLDLDPTDRDVTAEERIALAASRGFEAPRAIRGDRILVGGLRLPFADAEARGPAAASFSPGPGDVPPRDAPGSRFLPGRAGGVRGSFDPRYFPPADSTDPPVAASGLSAAEVLRVLAQGARQANRTRAAIRRPLGDRARVTVAVVDRGGHVLGVFRTADAPVFGFDVSVQKARTAAFLSGPGAAASLRAAGQGQFVDAAARDGIRLDGSVAMSDRAGGFLARPFFPDGIDWTPNGPFSRAASDFSIFNDGLQVELVRDALVAILSGTPRTECAAVAGLGNGIQIFPGSVPLYRDRTLVGGVGVSGDGVDQDDLVAAAGSGGFQAPAELRADRVFVRGVRLPYVKFPRRPTTR
jgi:uncharacterized protein GlcG (DUF336 family)